MTSATSPAKRMDNNNNNNKYYRINREGLRGWLNPLDMVGKEFLIGFKD